jgi:hypothetical protein
MNISKNWRTTGLFVLCIAGILPLLGNWLRDDGRAGCALDGMAIDQSRHVRLLDSTGTEHVFCSLRCAELWLRATNEKPEKILVTDEATGREIEASSAYFVRSDVMAHSPSNDHRHAFLRRENAEAHADTFRGRLLTGDDRPFATSKRNKS